MCEINDIFNELKYRCIITISTDELYKDINELTEDLSFFKELTSRTKKSRFDFICIPTFDGNIKGLFLRKIWCNALLNGLQTNKDTVTSLLKIYYILNGLFKSFDDINFNPDEPLILMMKNFDNFLSYNYSMTLCTEIGNFIGCSLSCNLIRERLEKIGFK